MWLFCVTRNEEWGCQTDRPIGHLGAGLGSVMIEIRDGTVRVSNRPTHWTFKNDFHHWRLNENQINFFLLSQFDCLLDCTLFLITYSLTTNLHSTIQNHQLLLTLCALSLTLISQSLFLSFQKIKNLYNSNLIFFC